MSVLQISVGERKMGRCREPGCRRQGRSGSGKCVSHQKKDAGRHRKMTKKPSKAKKVALRSGLLAQFEANSQSGFRQIRAIVRWVVQHDTELPKRNSTRVVVPLDNITNAHY